MSEQDKIRTSFKGIKKVLVKLKSRRRVPTSIYINNWVELEEMGLEPATTGTVSIAGWCTLWTCPVCNKDNMSAGKATNKTKQCSFCKKKIYIAPNKKARGE